jgi:D-glycero-alpha-D-manno-heptose-7-phosphate kinase
MYKSKAPFRLGLAGGGTDVSPYSDIYGGAVLNATVSLYAETTIKATDSGLIEIKEGAISQLIECRQVLEYNGELDLAKAVYNVIQKKYPFGHNGFYLETRSDVPTGSGLGTSSTIVVSILGAFLEWQKISMDQYEIAALAYHIEREELGMAGGKQDQYAAVFGGFNYITFGEKVRVQSIEVSDKTEDEISDHLILYFTRTNRESHNIILKQIDNVKQESEQSLQAMHDLKMRAIEMKNALEKSKPESIGSILNESWTSKKQMAVGISNPTIDAIYDKVMAAGAIGGKISGAGGGGFMIFYAGKNKRDLVIAALSDLQGEVVDYTFTKTGMHSWTEQ